MSSYEERENRVIISLQKKAGELTFRAYNTTDEGTVKLEIEKGGIGIANARRRLDLQYPGRHTLLIADRGDSYEVVLNLKINAYAAQSHYSR